jgi:hypothetical protein
MGTLVIFSNFFKEYEYEYETFALNQSIISYNNSDFRPKNEYSSMDMEWIAHVYKYAIEIHRYIYIVLRHFPRHLLP